jgi:hypothetical protein
MKHRFLFMIFLLTVGASAVFAQQSESLVVPYQFKPFAKIAPIKADTAFPNLALINSLYKKNWYRTGVQVDSVRMGKVYRMQFDNMLCLVPDTKQNAPMPVQRKRVPAQMPNSFRQPVVR